ncbi:MAG: hypothetical protein QG646_4041 [Euryarchaeota archaeon]|nr:hypothetical protein [Euryarchaeota archaeon]
MIEIIKEIECKKIFLNYERDPFISTGRFNWKNKTKKSINFISFYSYLYILLER